MSNAWWTTEGYITFKEGTSEERMTEVMNALKRSDYKFMRDTDYGTTFSVRQERAMHYGTLVGILKAYKDDLDDTFIVETMSVHGDQDVTMDSFEDE